MALTLIPKTICPNLDHMRPALPFAGNPGAWLQDGSRGRMRRAQGPPGLNI
jgi:hypothetical protein